MSRSSGCGSPRPSRRRPPPRTAHRSRVLLKGGCDLFLLNGFLGGRVKTEFTYPSETAPKSTATTPR